MPEQIEQNYRFQRIQRLLSELRYEITRGMMEREVDECLGYEFIIPVSSIIKDGVVVCQFRTQPMSQYNVAAGRGLVEPKLKIIK